MHIPDGFLAPPVFLAMDAVAIPAVGWLARRTTVRPVPEPTSEGALDATRIPLLGVMGAFVFAAQMINVPLGLGVSGHLLGGTLLSAVLGPTQAALVMTAVLILQALLFQDGGVLALGANVCNMALIGVFAGYLPLWLWGRRTWTLYLGASSSVLISGISAIIQLRFSGVAIPSAVFTAALAIFLAAGALEALITVATLRAIARLSPASLPAAQPVASFRMRAALAITACLLVTVGAAFASSAPDGLTHLAAQLGVTEKAVWNAPMAGYAIIGLGALLPGVNGLADWLARSTAGLAGLACIYLICNVAMKRR